MIRALDLLVTIFIHAIDDYRTTDYTAVLLSDVLSAFNATSVRPNCYRYCS